MFAANNLYMCKTKSVNYTQFTTWKENNIIITKCLQQGRAQDLGGGYSKFEVVQKKIDSLKYILLAYNWVLITHIVHNLKIFNKYR